MSNFPASKQDYDNDDLVPCKKAKFDDHKSNILPPFGNLVLFEYPDDAPQSIISRAVTARGGALDIKFDKNNTEIRFD